MTTKVNKKSLLKERLANSKVIENLLSDAAIGKQVDMEKVYSLIKRNEEINTLVFPLKKTTALNVSNPVLSESAREILEKYDNQHKVFSFDSNSFYCPKCGDINRNNILNGKLWCFKCNIPLTNKPRKKNSTSLEMPLIGVGNK